MKLCVSAVLLASLISCTITQPGTRSTVTLIPEMSQDPNPPAKSPQDPPQDVPKDPPQDPPQVAPQQVPQDDPQQQPAPQLGKRKPRFFLEPSVAFGKVKIDFDGGSNSDADAVMFQMAGEFVPKKIGGGVRFWGAASDDDMTFLGPGTETSMAGGFVHFTAKPKAGVFDLPIRAGFLIDSIRDDDDGGAGVSEVSFTNFGAQVEFMPEVNIDLSENMVLGFYGGGSLGYALTVVKADFPGLDETDTSTSLLYGLAVGARFTIGGFGGSIGYVYREWDMDDVTFDDAPGSPNFPGVSHQFSGLMLSGVIRF